MISNIRLIRNIRLINTKKANRLLNHIAENYRLTLGKDQVEQNQSNQPTANQESPTTFIPNRSSQESGRV